MYSFQTWFLSVKLQLKKLKRALLRLFFQKTKNESMYDQLVSLKAHKDEKDAKIREAAFQMELLYGRGKVFVDTEEFQKGLFSFVHLLVFCFL